MSSAYATALPVDMAIMPPFLRPAISPENGPYSLKWWNSMASPCVAFKRRVFRPMVPRVGMLNVRCVMVSSDTMSSMMPPAVPMTSMALPA